MTSKLQKNIFTPVLLELNHSIFDGLTSDSVVTSVQYPEEDRYGAFITMIQAISDGLLNRYIGEPVCIYILLKDARIEHHWRNYRTHVKEYCLPSYIALEKDSSPFFTEQRIVEILRDILSILVLKSIGNLREDHVHKSFLFRQMAHDCGLIFDENGEYIGKEDKFEMFLKRHHNLMQI